MIFYLLRYLGVGKRSHEIIQHVQIEYIYIVIWCLLHFGQFQKAYVINSFTK